MHNVSLVTLFKFNDIISQEPDCLNQNILNECEEANFLYFIVKEIYEYLNLITKDKIFILKLRRYYYEKKKLKHMIQNLKNVISNHLQEENKITI